MLAVGLISGSTGASFAQDFMSQEELLATIPGSTLSGISNTDGVTPWVQTYQKGVKTGEAAGSFGGRQYKATWAVMGDLWCEYWDGGSGCWQIERTEAKELQIYEAGRPLLNRWKIE